MTRGIYNREIFLRERLNTFLTREFNLPEADYYGMLGEDAILSLKSTLADINNILTVKLCLSFVNWLVSRFGLKDTVALDIARSVLSTKPSTNGFDIHVKDPIKIIAEVKCNVPINQGHRFGRNQRDGIEKDITALLKGKSKAPFDPCDYVKFLVLLDRPEVRDATEHLLLTSKICRSSLRLASEEQDLSDCDVVYVTYHRWKHPGATGR